MKLSIATLSALLLSSVSFAAADSYSDAIKSWCQGKQIECIVQSINNLGLSVTFPDASTVAVAGQKNKVTVSKYMVQKPSVFNSDMMICS